MWLFGGRVGFFSLGNKMVVLWKRCVFYKYGLVNQA